MLWSALARRSEKSATPVGQCLCWGLFKQLCARHSYVCRRGLYVIYIVTQTHSFRRSRELDKSNKFGQMQELTNNNYSEIKLYSIFHIEYKALEFSTNKNITNNYIPDPNIGTTTRQPLLMADLRIRRMVEYFNVNLVVSGVVGWLSVPAAVLWAMHS